MIREIREHDSMEHKVQKDFFVEQRWSF